MVANNDSTILTRVLEPAEGARVPRAAAEELLSLTFKPADVARMNELAALAQEGRLTPEQQIEMESYNRIGHFLALVHSKARLALKAAGGARRE